jgi:threonine dehydrogenase-like Zn-dependent dehydrogenase
MGSQVATEVSTSLVLNSFNGRLDLEKTPIPNPTPSGSVVVRVLSTPVRPHQRAGFHGKSALSFKPPYNPGDGGVGRVISVGPDTVALKPGQLVYMNSFVAARDDPNTRVLLGLHDGGGPEGDIKLFNFWKGFWRDIVVFPSENVLPLNERILVDEMGYSYGDLTYIQRLSVAYGGIRAANLQAGETVIVAPATGHFSGAVVELAAQIGCKVIALSRSVSKLEPLTSRFPRVTSLELTGDEKKDVEAIQALAPEGIDAYIDVSPPAATASPHHLTVSINSLSAFGRVVLLGMMFDIKVNYASLMVRNITIKAQFMYTREELVSLIKMLEGGVLKLGKEAGHHIVERGFRLEEWEEAVTVAEKAVGWGEQVLLYPSADVAE